MSVRAGVGDDGENRAICRRQDIAGDTEKTATTIETQSRATVDLGCHKFRTLRLVRLAGVMPGAGLIEPAKHTSAVVEFDSDVRSQVQSQTVSHNLLIGSTPAIRTEVCRWRVAKPLKLRREMCGCQQ